MLSLKRYVALTLLSSLITSLHGMDQQKKSLPVKLEAEIKARVTKRQEAQESQMVKVLEAQWSAELNANFVTPTAIADRILACTAKVQEHRTSLEPLLVQQSTIKAEQQKHALALLALSKQIEPIAAAMATITQKKTALVKDELVSKGKKIAATNIFIALEEFAMHEPVLCFLTKEQLTPLIITHIEEERKNIAQTIKEKKEAWSKLNSEISPFLKEQEQLQDADAQTKDSLDELDQKMKEVTSAQSLIEHEKAFFCAALDQLRTAKQEEKQGLLDDVDAIRATIPDEQDSNKKIEFRKRITQTERSIAVLDQTIGQVEQAIAKAKGIKASRGWFTGK